MISRMAAETFGAQRTGEPLDLRTVIDTIPALVVCALPDGSVEFVNQGWREYTGSSLEHLKGWGWQTVMHPDDLSKFTDEWNAARAAGKPLENEARVRRADGQYHWFSIKKVPLRDQADQIVRWYGTAYDIEDRKQAEDRLRVVVDATPALIHTGRPDGHLDYFNQRWLDYLGLSLEDVSGWRWTKAIHPEDVEGILQKWRASLASGEPFLHEARVRRADGEYRWMLHHKIALRDEHGKIVKWHGSSIDIEDRKRAEDELRRSEAYLSEAQKLSYTGSFGWNVCSGEVYWSRETFRIFGYEPTAKITIDLIVQRTHPEDRSALQELIERVSRERTEFDFEHRLLMPDGSVKYLRVVGTPSEDEGGCFEFVGAVTDVSEQRQAEAVIREREREVRQIVDLAPQLVSVFGPGRERLYANRVVLDYLGIGLDEWRQRSPGTHIHPDDSERVKACWDRALGSGSGYDVELRLRKHDGSYRWFLARYNPVRDDKGQIMRWYVAGTDIEDRKQAEQRLQHENVALREEIDKTSMFEQIVGSSNALQTVLSRVSKVAPTDSTVLISGETGTGKELVARAIHRRSYRSSRAFVSVNCAAVPRDLIASELFGHEKGAFTGATQQRLGRFELAGGGTIFLDEVGELPAETQIALLRVLQEHEFERVGGSRSLQTDVRVIAATNRDLQAAIAAGTFRSDLFYRLNVFPIEIPPLRERREDIPLLVEYFIDRYARKAGKSIRGVNKKTLDLLQWYPWPGNIRELQNVIERSVIVCETENFSVDESWLSRQPLTPEPKSPLDLSEKLAAQEKETIEAALRESGGRVFGPLGAAAKLGMPRSTLESKIRSLKINKNRFKA